MAMMTVVEAAQARRVVFDAPPQDPEGNIDPDALSGLVKQVSEEWCAHIPEKKTLALFLPHNQLSSKLSREHFVDLLEYCEDELGFRRVLACFNKDLLDPKQGIPRALRCIGFNVLSPEQFPACLDKQKIFAMVYNI